MSESAVEREHDGAGAVADVELGEDGADVALHGPLAHTEGGGDLAVVGAARHEA
jgi:hypothetical protein